MAPHVRAVRKVNGDQVAIAIDNEQDNNALNDEDDDKGKRYSYLPSFLTAQIAHISFFSQVLVNVFLFS